MFVNEFLGVFVKLMIGDTFIFFMEVDQYVDSNHVFGRTNFFLCIHKYMNTMQSMKLKLTDAQLRKLAKGKGVMVKPSDMAESGYDIYCTAKNCKKMCKAQTMGKGMCLRLSPEEMKANEVELEEGGRINWRKIGRTLRTTAKAIGKLYREEVRPEVGPALRRIVKKGIEKGIPFATSALATALGQPELAVATRPFIAKIAQDIAEPATQGISKLTGAFGVKKVKLPKAKAMKMATAVPVHSTREMCPVPFKAQLQNNYSNFLNPNHPGMNPTLPALDNSLPIVSSRMHSGQGLFMNRGTGMRGLASDPQLPPQDNSMSRVHFRC